MKRICADNPAGNLFGLKKPCANCPFLKEGAIELKAGRLKGIVTELITGEAGVFHCHKTVYNSRTGGEHDGEGKYKASGAESICAGALIYLEKIQHPILVMQLGRAYKVYDPEVLRPAFEQVIDTPYEDL